MAEAYLHAKFHLDPSSRLDTIHQRYRQDRTDRQTEQTDNGLTAYVCCGQTAEWIKRPLGVEICLGPGEFCLLYTSDAADE